MIRKRKNYSGVNEGKSYRVAGLCLVIAVFLFLFCSCVSFDIGDRQIGVAR